MIGSRSINGIGKRSRARALGTIHLLLKLRFICAGQCQWSHFDSNNINRLSVSLRNSNHCNGKDVEPPNMMRRPSHKWCISRKAKLQFYPRSIFFWNMLVQALSLRNLSNQALFRCPSWPTIPLFSMSWTLPPNLITLAPPHLHQTTTTPTKARPQT